MPKPTEPRRREWSTLAHLVLLVTALLVPLLALTSVLLSRFAIGELASLAALGLAALILSALAATWFGHQVARPMRELARAGAALGRGEAVTSPRSSVTEVNDVARSLAAAAVDLAARGGERDAVEAALRDSETQFRQLAEALPMIVWVMRPDGEAIYQNDRFRDYHGYDVSSALSDRSSNIHPDDKGPAWAIREPAVASGSAFQADVRLRRADGAYRWHRMSAVPLKRESGEVFAWVGTATDIDDVRRAEQSLKDVNETLEVQVAERTRELSDNNLRLVAEIAQRERIEEQLRQSQKMEAVGQLTGGIAHDFNNLLAVITGSLQMLQRRLDRGETGAVQRYLDGAMEGADRAATLTHRLLAFSRQQPLAPEPVDPNRLVAGMSDLLRRTIGESIRIETVLAGGLWSTHADPNQLENAVLNLAVNGRDAMEEGGRLTIETANCDLDTRYTADNAGVTPGQYVLIAVTDTGAGMPPEVVAKAFDPFFTTKPVGQGTGLGLSQVYGFVRQSGGHVKIYSEPGQGTTVKLYLPRFLRVEISAATPRPQPALATGASDEIVLVVEDDAAVRRLTVEALAELGYGVLEAANAAAALRQLDARADVQLLFTDIVMPDMNGRKLAEEALRRRPELKVLFTTGYTRNAIVHNGVLDAGVNLLGKPFTMDQLAAKVREILDH